MLAGLLAALAASCGGSGGSSRPNLDNVRVAAVIKGLDNPFFVTMRDGLVATAQRDHARLRVAAAPTGVQDTAGQGSALQSLTTDGPACYVVNPINQTNLIPALAGVPQRTPIINLDSRIGKRPAQAVGVKITTYIGTDNIAGGMLAADAVATRVGRGTHVAVIAGIPGDAPSGDRVQGFRRGVRGRFDVVGTIAADYDREKARLAAEHVLRADPQIAGFFAVNDLMALGVADAVGAAGKRGKVAVVGVDGIRAALAAVRRGAMSATVSQYPYSIGQLGIEACLAALRGERLPANVDSPIRLITRKNVARAQASFPKPPGHFESPFGSGR
jgi:ABC-type sugar transport system substrate-binding protein